MGVHHSAQTSQVSGQYHRPVLPAQPCPLDSSIKEHDEQRLRGLVQMCKRLGIYEYYINGSWPDLPRLSVPCCPTRFACVSKQGFDTIPRRPRWFCHHGLNYYVAAKLLWDADTDVAALLDDYYAQGYGPARCPCGSTLS